MDGLISEYEQVKAHGFTLDFTYPTQSQRNHMNVVNRDMSEAEKMRVRNSQTNMAGLIADLESGKFSLKDWERGTSSETPYALGRKVRMICLNREKYIAR